MITLSIHLNRIHSFHKKVLSLAPAHPQSFFRLVLILLSINACLLEFRRFLSYCFTRVCYANHGPYFNY